jgi:integrase
MSERRGVGSIRKLPSGKYLLRLSAQYDEFGNRIQLNRTVDVKTEREAEKALYDFYAKREKLRDEKVARAPETLGELYDEWLKNHVESTLREKTAETYKSYWKNHLSKYEKSKLKTFTPRMIYDILAHTEPVVQFKKDGKPRAANVKTGDRLKKGIFGMLKAIFNQGVKWGYMNDNPCFRVDAPTYKATEKGYYNETDIASIIEIVLQEDLKYQAIFFFAALCGLRRGEIVGLQWKDINYAAMTFAIEQAATRLAGQGTKEGETKNKKSMRTLQLPETLVPILHSLHADQAQRKLKLGEKWIDGDYIFTQWNGKLMCVDTPTTWWTKMRAKHPEFPAHKSLHTLRHTMATYMIQNNVPVSDVSGALGHSQQSTTLNIYSHVIEDSKKAAMTSYEQRILKCKKTVK